MYGKKRKLTELEFVDIPPRVVIEILSLIGCKFHGGDQLAKIFGLGPGEGFDLSICEKYGLYGYFKKDRLRHIWMIFSSLYLGKHFNIEDFIITYPKLKCLVFYVGNSKVCQGILKIPKFHILESLEIFEEEKEGNFVDSLLSKKDICLKMKSIIDRETSFKFPCLECLRIVENVIVVVNRGFTSSSDTLILKNLRNLTLFNCSVDCDFSRGELSRLKRLEVCSVVFIKPKMLNLPELKILVFGCNCSTIGFSSLPKLEDLRIFVTSIEKTREIIKVSKKIRELFAYSVNVGDWFLSFFDNTLEFLETIKIMSISNFTGSSKHIMLGKCNNLKEIYISNCRSLEEYFFFTEIKSLGKLEIHHQEVIYSGREKWKMLWNLEILVFENFENLSDRIFQESEIPNLKVLDLKRMDKLTGENWKEFPELKFINLMVVVNFSDSFFSNMKQAVCKKLERIVIDENSKLLGCNWGGKEFSNLTKIEFSDCCELSDCVFTENSFPKLEYLLLCRNYMTGAGWKKLEALKSLELFYCDFDSFFIEHESPLQELEFYQCECTGNNWKFMKDLKELRYGSMDETFLENLSLNMPFSEKCILREIME